MSVTFSIRGAFFDWDDSRTYLNVSNVNARALLEWLGLEADEALTGSVRCSELAARCRRRLWGNVARNEDPGESPFVERGTAGAVLFVGGRRPGYLRERTEQLLALAMSDPEGIIDFG